MDHGEAMEMQVVERYLLGECSATQEDEFAEHFFDCEECASDLRMTSLFLDTAKKVLAKDRAAKGESRKRWGGRWQPAPYAVAASIALLAFTLYQNAVTIPRLRSSSAPQALALFSLTGMGARSAGSAVISPTPGKPFALLLDIAPHDNVVEYRCQILNSNGGPVVSIDLAEDAVKKTVPLLIPASGVKPGAYQFTISGRGKNETAFTELERYPLQVE